MNISKAPIFLVLLFFSSFLFASQIKAQNFDEGVSLYEEQEYEQAANIFTALDTKEAALFAGKSYFGMGQYLKAKTYLSEIDTTAGKELFADTKYTAALADFQLKNFDSALSSLYWLANQGSSQLSFDARKLYSQILDYLTIQQRKEVFQRTQNPGIRFDLVKAAFKKVDYKTAKVLLGQLKQTLKDTLFNNYLSELEQMVADSVSYRMERTFGESVLDAPEGMTYNIGAPLPEYSTEENEFGISQGLYFGYIMAVEEFNQKQSDKQAFIRHKNTSANPDSIDHIMTDFAWNYSVDAILGPLFSEPAAAMASLTEQYQIPMLAPLANADSLNNGNPYVFQANPTFASHGKKMAQYAVEDLQMDTLAVLAERGSLGETSAFAFRDEAEKLGAKVAYFFVEDLKDEGYEITSYSKHFTTDSTVIDSLGYHYLDAVYAPFTGQVAATLIDLLLIDLQGLDSNLPVLGSQEWGGAWEANDINPERLKDRTIYFSESYYINSKSDRLEAFNNRFNDRFGMEPNRFALIGYDAAMFLLRGLERSENPALLKEALKNQPIYEGLISNIHFDGRQVNQEVKIFKLTQDGISPAKY
ncbi:MAG: ABC transporter substrate-binding protein [Balneolaceae bacterium]|nr:ABC transporter substrate-binding protein [Balneolaceae bacterium]